MYSSQYHSGSLDKLTTATPKRPSGEHVFTVKYALQSSQEYKVSENKNDIHFISNREVEDIFSIIKKRRSELMKGIGSRGCAVK